MSGTALHLDAFAGIAGDMFCAALLDLGADLDALRDGLSALPVTGYHIRAERVRRGPFSALRFEVLPPGGSLPAPDAHDHGHEHGHDHHHGGGRGMPPDLWSRWPGQPERTWAGIRRLLESAPLPARVRARAIRTFSLLAQAEARVHGVAPEDVHFHEVGAVDSIVDIVGTCICLELLDIDTITCGPLPMGQGLIRSAHGWIPLPVPATVEVLRGWPVVAGPAGRELVTPTGAALVAALASPGPLPPMCVLGTGHGAGTRDPPDLPNVLRVIHGRPQAADSPQTVEVIEAQMDDLPGEHLPPLLEALLAAGALDAHAAPVWMKKGRSGLWVQALAEPHRAVEVELALLRHGSTFGVRRHTASRRTLLRRHVQVPTPWGEVRVKLGELDGEVIQAAPEYEDVRAVALSAGVPVRAVHAAALRSWEETRRS